MIKHIFSDMDGTLLDKVGGISATNAQAIYRLNTPFTLVSARAPMEMDFAMDRLQLKDPQIAFNGGLIFEKNESGMNVLSENPIDNGTVETIFKLIKDEFPEISISWYGLEHWYSERNNQGTALESRFTNLLPDIVTQNEFLDSDDTRVFKIMMIIFDEEELQAVGKAILDLKSDLISIQRSGTYYIEVTSNKAVKSTGIQFIMDREGLKKDELVAFGDSQNDIPMFEAVGYPIVMDNAPKNIKELAKYVTLANHDDGISYAINNYLPTIQA
ncbi:HAD family hydrolase [Companilactobacillus mishanensis]|uniref:HAD family hydrolase n=1 Tax=Companilactobacillus mishanensis TaxID=2486008 RepID=A0ABW9P973_9LACO|nr:HAD family hydrolase [Companilactobacillus mishanensis]MQS45775.1 HAD family hydrolase [Companilactobacillus mishanensis]